MLKIKPYRNEKFLAWVREKPCCHCGRPSPSQAHHIIGIGGNRGAGLKADDSQVIPLCHECHSIVHGASGTVKIDQLFYFARLIESGFRSGELKIK